jgi:hypothetical protein
MGAETGAATAVANGQTSRMKKTICGGDSYRTHPERRGQFANGRELLVADRGTGVFLDGVSDLGSSSARYPIMSHY